MLQIFTLAVQKKWLNHFMKFLVKYIKMNRIVLIICFLSIGLITTGCNRKIGVKPNGQQKISTSKCKCKKKVGIYSDNFSGKPFCFINRNQVGMSTVKSFT